MNYGAAMIIPCADRYAGRYCPVCGVCSCRRSPGPGLRPAWAPTGADPRCPLHGQEVGHGRTKVVTADRGSGRRMGVQDEVGVQDWFRVPPRLAGRE